MTEPPLSVDEINRLDPAAFVARFGDVAEHSPWVAEIAAGRRPFADREAMIAAFHAAIDAAGSHAQRFLLEQHPDLGGRAGRAGAIAADSQREQAGAGLDQLTEAESAQLAKLNNAYLFRHGIPFILAVRGATKETILKALATRMPNDPDAEFRAAVREVKKIVRFRLEDRVAAG